jgi:hypothetical protein
MLGGAYNRKRKPVSPKTIIAVAVGLVLAVLALRPDPIRPVDGKCPEGTTLVSTKTARPDGTPWKWIVGEPWPEEYCR